MANYWHYFLTIHFINNWVIIQGFPTMPSFTINLHSLPEASLIKIFTLTNLYTLPSCPGGKSVLSTTKNYMGECLINFTAIRQEQNSLTHQCFRIPAKKYIFETNNRKTSRKTGVKYVQS